jgi:hypothetical protein
MMEKIQYKMKRKKQMKRKQLEMKVYMVTEVIGLTPGGKETSSSTAFLQRGTSAMENTNGEMTVSLRLTLESSGFATSILLVAFITFIFYFAEAEVS